ncbi:MAG: hypothetical protein QE487_12160 [Fluviicola sp.]|nr:hypothetical protein [Fluviicola sp.]
MKQWKKTQEGVYEFLVNDQQIGVMNIAQAKMERKAVVQMQAQSFTIKRAGFWKSSISITDQQDLSVAEIYPTKWYSKSYTMDYNGKKHRISARNNPLAEWVIKEDDVELMAYGLETVDGKIAVKITSSETTDHFFDALLWYLFLPIAAENSGDDVTFLMLIA